MVIRSNFVIKQSPFQVSHLWRGQHSKPVNTRHNIETYEDNTKKPGKLDTNYIYCLTGIN